MPSLSTLLRVALHKCYAAYHVPVRVVSFSYALGGAIQEDRHAPHTPGGAILDSHTPSRIPHPPRSHSHTPHPASPQVIDVQNCFMESRKASRPDAQHAVPANQHVTLGGEQFVGAGSLQVFGSSAIVPIINDWMSVFSANATGSVATTQDWHPSDHCSFCRFGEAAKGASSGRMVAAYNPGVQQHADVTLGASPAERAAASYGVCLTGGGANTFMSSWPSTRCQDTVSVADFTSHRLYTWPDHCVKSSFGAELDPWLKVPPSSGNIEGR